MKEIVQHLHAIGYWEKSGRRDEEKFVELANFGVKFVRHVSMPTSLAKKYSELNSGFVSTVSYISGEQVVEK